MHKYVLWYNKFSHTIPQNVFSFLRVCGDFSIRIFCRFFFCGWRGWELEINGVLTPYVCDNTHKSSVPTHLVTNTVSPNVHTYMIEALSLSLNFEARLDFEASRPRWRCSAWRSLPNVQTIASSTCKKNSTDCEVYFIGVNRERERERDMERFGQRSAILMMDRSSLLGMILG
jgi:hypothetical protein